MLLEYIAIAVMIAVATLIAFIAIGMGELFGPKKDNEAKSMPYESGMLPTTRRRRGDRGDCRRDFPSRRGSSCR